ncbi:MAG: tyrosinase [Solirubrobacteraceae bacterium]|nr:tyrosinase [Solirubrobacteraceae bacterium]
MYGRAVPRSCLLVLTVLATAMLPAPADAALVVRKDAKDLSAQETSAFVAAVLKLKHTRAPGRKDGISIYDAFVEVHALAFEQSRDPAHGGAAFLPWHRAFLHAFEQQLQKVSGNDTIALPYWDWTNPASTRAVFSPALMGGSGDRKHDHAVTSGPFRRGRWKLWSGAPTVGAGPGSESESASPFLPHRAQGGIPIVGGPHVVRGTAAATYLQRELGGAEEDGITKLPTAEDMASVLGVQSYDSKPWNDASDARYSFRCALEGWGRPAAVDDLGSHNLVHMWVGGEWRSQGELVAGTIASGASPNDPAFWLIHANVERLWAQWEQTHGPAYDAGAGAGAGHHLHDKLRLLRRLGRDIGDTQLASGTLRPEDLLDPAPWEDPYQQPLA